MNRDTSALAFADGVSGESIQVQAAGVNGDTCWPQTTAMSSESIVASAVRPVPSRRSGFGGVASLRAGPSPSAERQRRAPRRSG
jgi:hypothetical protein